MSLVRVSEGDGWVSDLSQAPNKSLTPITLACQPFLPSNLGQQGQIWPQTCRDESELIQV